MFRGVLAALLVAGAVLVAGLVVVGFGGDARAGVVAAGAIPVVFPNASNTGPSDESLIPATASGRVVSEFDGQVLENFHATDLLIYHHNHLSPQRDGT